MNTINAQDMHGVPSRARTPTLLFVSPSLKPAPGHSSNSASRWLLEQAAQQLGQVYPGIAMLDLRTHVLPQFQGLKPNEVNDDNTAKAAEAISGSEALLIAVPGYWSGVSASFKNFIELMCGAAYDYPPPIHTIFSGKAVGLLVVGADADSTRHAQHQAQLILTAVGAELCGQPVCLTDPRRNGGEINRALVETLELGVSLISAMAKGT